MPAAAEGGFKLLSFSTLLGEIFTFAILVWVVMKYVWPPLMNAIESRQKEIADGLAAAEQGRQELQAADERKDEVLSEARAKATAMIADGDKRKGEIVNSARGEAESEKSRILEQGKRELELERAAMYREMEQKVGNLALNGASQILGREINAEAHGDIVESLQKQLQS
ncbi:MAG: F0F1 ATP synthase subunit B [Gammaproteobacteria bacterium WSBS_2016_MAG_OTU1]